MSEAMSMPDDPPESERAAVAPGVVGFPDPILPGSCPVCGSPLTGRQRVACSDRCRAELSRRRKAQAQAERETQVRAYLQTAGEALEAADRVLRRG